MSCGSASRFGLCLVVTLATCAPALQVVSSPRTGDATRFQDIRSSQNTVLESATGQVEKVRLGVKLFLDADDVLVSLPEEFLGRRLIRSHKGGG